MAFRKRTFDALRVAIDAAWPETTPNGIYRVREMAQIAWEKKAAAAELPLALIDWAPQEGTRWGLINRVEEGPCTIYYVAGPGMTAPALDDHLEALAHWLATNPLELGQMIGQASCSDAIDLVPNRYFLFSNRPFSCGCVTFTLKSGETP